MNDFENDFKYFVEVFPLEEDQIPPLFLYRLVGEEDTRAVQGKVLYQMKKHLEGHWVWRPEGIVSDQKMEAGHLDPFLEGLWQERPEGFGSIQAIEIDEDWEAGAEDEAEFFSRGPLTEWNEEIEKILTLNLQVLGEARVERIYETKGWVVEEKPSLSLSIFSRIVHRRDLREFMKDLSSEKKAIGLGVVAKGSTLWGEIVALVGKLKKHRRRLQALSQEEEMHRLLEEAPDDDWVVKVFTGRYTYEYTASALQVHIRRQDYRDFSIRARDANQAMRLEPKYRVDLIKNVSHLLKSHDLIDDSYNSIGRPELFLTSGDYGYDPQIQFGFDQVLPYNPGEFARYLRDFDLYRRRKKEGAESLDVAVVNAMRRRKVEDFMEKLKFRIEDLDFHFSHREVIPVSRTYQSNFQGAINRVFKEEPAPDVVLLFLPSNFRPRAQQWQFFRDLRFLSLSHGVPTQVVYQSSLHKEYSLYPLIIGLLAKTNHTPYVLANPFSEIDRFIGLNLSFPWREEDGKDCYAMVRYFDNRGELRKYSIHHFEEGEGRVVPVEVWKKILPQKYFGRSNLLFHMTGVFPEEARRTFDQWLKAISATATVAEFLTWGIPRVYGFDKGQVVGPPRGSAFQLSEREVFFVSSESYDNDFTPQPVYIRKEGDLPTEMILKSALSLTLLHYGVAFAPRLPVTLYRSSHMTALVREGILKEGDWSIPIWL